MSEANVKTNRMGSGKWTYNKKGSFTGNYFILLKILIQSIRTTYKELI